MWNFNSKSNKTVPKRYKRRLHGNNRSINLDQSEPFVRVIYNGLDITQLIPSCEVEKQSVVSSNDGNEDDLFIKIFKTSPMCSLKALNKQINSIIMPHKDFEGACKTS